MMDELKLAPPAISAEVPDFQEVVSCCDRSQIGKRLPGALYVHVSALSTLERSLQDYENLARQHLKKLEGATLVKFSTDQPRVSYLSYPDFDTDAHPALQWSVQVDLVTSQMGVRNYNSADNPPVLHQKELLVQSDYPLYEKFAKLSRQEADWGLLDAVRKMSGGDSLCVSTHRRGWQKCLEEHCAELKGYRVVWRKDADPYRVKLVKSAQRQRTDCIALKENHQTKLSDPGSHSQL